MKLAIAVVAVVVGLAGTAHAGGLADAIARHAPADVDALRAQLPGDPSIRCTLGAVYAKRGELPRAGVYLAECDDAKLPAEISDTIAKLAIETKHKLRDSELAVLEIVTKPAGMTAEISALPGDQLVTPVTLWIPAGTYEVKATLAGREVTTIANHVTTAAHSRSVLFLENKAPAVGVVKPGKADFTDEAEPSERHEGPPPPVKRGSMMSPKLRGIADPDAAGPHLDDPLALADDPPPPAPTMSFGVRAGSGVAGSSAGSPIGLSLGLEGHFAIAGDAKPLELVLRVDYLTHKGNGVMTSILGSSAGVMQVLAAPDTAWLSAGVALHAISRTNEPGHTNGFGLTADALLELALRRLPIVVAARYEQGLSATDEHAMLVELGYDFRVF